MSTEQPSFPGSAACMLDYGDETLREHGSGPHPSHQAWVLSPSPAITLRPAPLMKLPTAMLYLSSRQFTSPEAVSACEQ